MTEEKAQERVHTFQDSYAADMFMGLLEDEDIPGTSLGSQQGGMLGVSGRYQSVSVSVPPQDLEKARELLTLFLSESSLESPYRGSEGKVPPPTMDRRRKRIAIMAAFFLPLGGGHFYARSMAAGWSLLGLSLMGIFASFRDVPTWMGYWPLAVVLYDALFSGSAAERTNAQETWPVLKQCVAVVVGASVIAVMLWQAGVLIDGLTVET